MDKRQEVIDRINGSRASSGLPPLIPRQEHLVREFIADDGSVSMQDAQLLRELLASNSA